MLTLSSSREAIEWQKECDLWIEIWLLGVVYTLGALLFTPSKGVYTFSLSIFSISLHTPLEHKIPLLRSGDWRNLEIVGIDRHLPRHKVRGTQGERGKYRQAYTVPVQPGRVAPTGLSFTMKLLVHGIEGQTPTLLPKTVTVLTLKVLAILYS